MPVYNTERYVAEAVERILAQTFGDFEFIIIDDGSTDGSRAILERYTKKDDRIRLISRSNNGIVGARNEALEMARGELIAVMDSDDVALPERLEVQLAYQGALRGRMLGQRGPVHRRGWALPLRGIPRPWKRW